MVAAASLARLGAWIESRRVADGTPGLALAIIDRSGVVHEQGFGLANLDAKIPVAPSHLFEPGSIGKSFTAIALLQLQEEGKIDLQAPVTDYLPWFSVQSEFEPIRLHHLLTHTAGITSGLDFAPDARIQVWALRDTWTTTPPGAHFHYSNVGYKTLGVVLERVAGAPYRETIQRRILDPLGLIDSFPTITHEIRPRMAVGYGAAFDDRVWWPGRPLAPATWFETDTADGCLAMTAADLARYLAVLVKGGEGLLSPESFALLTGKGFEFPAEPEPNWYGYGIMASIVDGHHYIGHSGGMVGYHARMIGDLETGLGVTVLINGPGSPSVIARTALDFLRAESEAREFSFPENHDLTGLDNAGDFAGAYRAPDSAESITFSAAERQLSLELDGCVVPLAALGGDSFGADATGLDRFAFVFERQDGNVTSVAYGGETYVNDAHIGETNLALPADWTSIPGRYKSHNPWLTSFDVVARLGRLWLITPTASDGFDGAEPLAPARDGWFQLGEDKSVPEFMRFDHVVDGVPLEATLSIGTYYRAEG